MIDRLVNLGLSTYEATAYLTLLKRGEASPVEVAIKAKIPRQRVYDVLSSLHSKGFCLMKETTPKCYAAVDPVIALSRFRELEAQAFLENESRKKAESQIVAKKLLTLFEKGSTGEHVPPPIELLKEENMMASRILEMIERATSSVSVTMRSHLQSQNRHNQKIMDLLLKKGLQARVLIDQSYLDGSDLEWVHNLRASGNEVRSLATIPVKLSIVDDQSAFLAIPADETQSVGFTGVIVSHASTVEFLSFAFDQLWVQSRKINLPRSNFERSDVELTSFGRASSIQPHSDQP